VHRSLVDCSLLAPACTLTAQSAAPQRLAAAGARATPSAAASASSAPTAPTATSVPPPLPCRGLTPPAITPLESTSTSISPAVGGTVQLSTGDRIVIPAGALPAGSNVVISINSLPRAAFPVTSATAVAAGDIREFGPSGLQFLRPVTISLKFDASFASLADATQTLRVFYFNPTSGLWELVGGAVDVPNRLVNVNVTHFSLYGVQRDTALIPTSTAPQVNGTTPIPGASGPPLNAIAIGVGVGVGVGGALIIVIIVVVIMRRRRRNANVLVAPINSS
jgi:hypothetical protein